MSSTVVYIRLSTDLLTSLLRHVTSEAGGSYLPLSKADLIRTCLRDYCRFLSIPIIPADPASLLSLNSLGRPVASTLGSPLSGALPSVDSHPTFASFASSCLSASPTTPPSALISTFRSLYPSHPDASLPVAELQAQLRAPEAAPQPSSSSSILKLLPILAADSAFSRQPIEEIAANYITYHPSDTYPSTLSAIRDFCLSHSIPFTSSLGGEGGSAAGAAEGGPNDATPIDTTSLKSDFSSPGA